MLIVLLLGINLFEKEPCKHLALQFSIVVDHIKVLRLLV